MTTYAGLAHATARSCKDIPGDTSWPTPGDWDKLNHTVEGRLIATIPLASVCHTAGIDNYNETACEALKAEWDFAQAQFVSVYL